MFEAKKVESSFRSDCRENEIDTGKSSEFAEPLRRFFQGSIPEGVKLDFSTDYCVDMPPKVWTAVE